MDRAAVLETLGQYAVTYQMTGGRYICNPAPTGTDEDYIALVAGDDWVEALCEAGFTLNTDCELYADCPDFYAWRGGEFNVICVEEPEMYRRWVDATEQAKAQNLLAKEDRIALFQKVLYGVEAAQPF
jgi:hypothetical protein